MNNKLMTTTNPSYANYFRRRTIGRAASPPTFACYEQRGNPYDNDDDEYSDEDGSEDHASCSEDGEDYGHRHPESDPSDTEDHHIVSPTHPDNGVADVEGMELDEGDDGIATKKAATIKKDLKGKQRAIEPEPESPKRQHRPKKPRQPVYTLRPILTIQRSQGFVWNQVSLIPTQATSQKDTNSTAGSLCSTVHQRPMFVSFFLALHHASDHTSSLIISHVPFQTPSQHLHQTRRDLSPPPHRPRTQLLTTTKSRSSKFESMRETWTASSPKSLIYINTVFHFSIHLDGCFPLPRNYLHTYHSRCNHELAKLCLWLSQYTYSILYSLFSSHFME